jgi:hypothetical protein
MSTRQPTLDTISAGTRNAELAFDLVQEQLANPELLEEIPSGATLILVPDDDPVLAEHNLRLAREVFATGRNVFLYHVPARLSATLDDRNSAKG